MSHLVDLLSKQKQNAIAIFRSAGESPAAPDRNQKKKEIRDKSALLFCFSNRNGWKWPWSDAVWIATESIFGRPNGRLFEFVNVWLYYLSAIRLFIFQLNIIATGWVFDHFGFDLSSWRPNRQVYITVTYLPFRSDTENAQSQKKARKGTAKIPRAGKKRKRKPEPIRTIFSVLVSFLFFLFIFLFSGLFGAHYRHSLWLFFRTTRPLGSFFKYNDDNKNNNRKLKDQRQPSYPPPLFKKFNFKIIELLHFYVGPRFSMDT